MYKAPGTACSRYLINLCWLTLWAPRTHPVECVMQGKCGFSDCGPTEPSLRLLRNHKSYHAPLWLQSMLLGAPGSGFPISPSFIRTSWREHLTDFPSEKLEAHWDDCSPVTSWWNWTPCLSLWLLVSAVSPTSDSFILNSISSSV